MLKRLRQTKQKKQKQRQRQRKQSRKQNKKTRKQLYGGTVTPFNELSGFFSGLGNSFSNLITPFTVSASGYNLPNDSSLSSQFLRPPETATLNQLYDNAYK